MSEEVDIIDTDAYNAGVEDAKERLEMNPDKHGYGEEPYKSYYTRGYNDAKGNVGGRKKSRKHRKGSKKTMKKLKRRYRK